MMTPSQVVSLDGGGNNDSEKEPLLFPRQTSVIIMRPHSIRQSSSMARTCWKYLISGAIVVILVVAIVFLYHETQIVPVNYLGYHESKSRLGIYNTAAITTDTVQCSEIGKNILLRNGSAVDAAIASLLCMGLVIPESLGFGGGCFITYYDATEKKSYVINAREYAPSYAKDGMFKYSNESARGPLAVAIPGELIGYELAHKRWGKLPWSELFTDSINLAENGFPISEHLSTAVKQQQKFITSEEYKLKDVFMKEGRLIREGEIMKRPELAVTMRKIALEGSKTLYGGQVGKDLIDDFKEQGGQIELSELASYKARNDTPFIMNLPNNLTLHSVNLPGSGPLLGLILNVMMRYTDHGKGKTMIETIKFYQRFAETMKFAYAKRQLLGDPNFEEGVEELIKNITSNSFTHHVMDQISDSQTFNDPQHYIEGPDVKLFREDHGTAAMSVIDQYGNAISVGSTINSYFGSKIISPKTGIILNNEMDDFSNENITSDEFDLPPSDHNKVEANKIPLSSMCPTIITNSSDGKVLMVIGGSGGTQITTSVALVILRSLFFHENIKRAVDGPRIHHQLLPMKLQHEGMFNPIILQELTKKGHVNQVISGRGSIVMALRRREDGKLEANSDFRKGGDVNGF